MSGYAVVRVPASTSNLGAGFDCVGVAVDRWLTVAATIDDGATVPVSIERRGTLAGLALAPDHDHLTAGFRAACRATGNPVPAGLAIRAHSEIPVARGLGSSGAAVVAGAAAANTLLDLGLDDWALIAIATELEGHPDNVAAAVRGGTVIVLDARESGPGVIVRELSVHRDLVLVLAVPDFAVETKHARSILPRRVAHELAVRAAARSAALVHGLSVGDAALLAQGLDDVLHVPFRTSLVPGYDDVVQAARRAGAHGATLSGSGSSIVAVAPCGRADEVGAAMSAAWAKHGVAATHFTNAGRVAGYSATLDVSLPQSLLPHPSSLPLRTDMAITLQLPTVLAKLADSRDIEAHGQTVGEVVADVAERYPALAPRLRDSDGNPYPFVTFYLNDEDIRLRGGFATPVRDGDELTVVPAIAGG